MTTYRERFVVAMEQKLDFPVLWGCKGPRAFDCSGSVTRSYREVGGEDLTETVNAQGLANKTRPLGELEAPLPGDLVFFGFGEQSIEHVAVYLQGGRIISADGATSHIDPKVLGFDKALELAMANPSHRVRLHDQVKYRHDTPFIAVHRNTLVDALDGVEQ